jgi:2-polyprenyl-3-methyl-5-hydroxy-6-metoxy-1,4-benzoquinol methylase
MMVDRHPRITISASTSGSLSSLFMRMKSNNSGHQNLATAATARWLYSLAQPIMLICILWVYHLHVFSRIEISAIDNVSHRVDQIDFIRLEAPPNLPSLLVSTTLPERNASMYGGFMDKDHLGGFLLNEIDREGLSPGLWNFMIGQLAVKSMVDVGCGQGHSLKYFHDRGARCLCVEGSHHAVLTSVLPPNVVVEHDFTRGPWWPSETFDVAWSVEFLEHVGRQYMRNYMPIFKKSALIFATSSMWGGWHHVEVRPIWWWLGRFSAQGLIYSPELTEACMQAAEPNRTTEEEGGHIRARLMVFINPAVASLPQHAHLFGGHGCHQDVWENAEGGTPCVGADAVPSEFLSLLECFKLKEREPPFHTNEGWEKRAFRCGKTHATIQWD